MPRLSLLLALLFSLFLSVTAPAALPLFNTGVDAAGHPLPDGTVGDPHYTLVAWPAIVSPVLRVRTSAGGYPITTDPILGDWLPDNPTSAWLATYNGTDVYTYGGTYTYRTTFSLPFTPTTPVTITGQWSTDDGGADILLNGLSSGTIVTGSAPFESWHPFTLTGPAHAGTNTIDFVTTNQYAPTGLRVEFLTAILPEPTTAALLAATLLLSRRHRRRHT